MNDPVRWQDDASVDPELRALLEHAEPPPPVDAGAHRAMAAFAANLTATKAAAAAGTLGLGAKVLAGLLAVSAATGVGLWAAGGGSTPATPAAPRAARVAPVAAPAPDPREEVARDPLPVVEDVVVAGDEVTEGVPPEAAVTPAPPSRAERAVRPRAPSPDAIAPAPAPAPEATLVAEAALLEQARAALATDPMRALGLTDTHAREHAAGQLAAERELIAVDALLRLGRSDEAARRAHALIARAPRGIYARRAERMLERAQRAP